MARACDRCSRLKTQCNGDVPCNRCQRLGLECTQTRPVLAKGRPKRDASNTRPKRSQNAPYHVISQAVSPQSTTGEALSHPSPSASALELVRHLPDLPLPTTLAAHLLDLVFSSKSNFGFLEVFPELAESLSPTRLQSVDENRLNPCTPISSKAVLYTLMVVGACLLHSDDPSINITSLQQYALNYVPALYGSSRELKMDDALALCLLSYVGCLHINTVKVAERWAVLAVTIAHQAQVEEDSSITKSEVFNQRVSWLIRINDTIFSLLHHRHPLGKHLGHDPIAIPSHSPINTTKSVMDKMSIGGVLQDPIEVPKISMAPDYFSLFLPLLEPLDIALTEPAINSSLWQDALTMLAKYYSQMPSLIPKYDKITKLYQLEAVVWFHGIHLLLYGNRDLYTCLIRRSWSSTASALKTTEHAMLLGEQIHWLVHSMKTSSQLSPATIYFLVLSAIIHASLLRQLSETFNLSLSSSNQVNKERASWTKIMESSRSHLFILKRIRDDLETCTIDLLQAVEDVLQESLTAATTSNKDWDLDVSTLRLYRWIGQGRGIVKIGPRIADEISKLEVGDLKASMGSAVVDSGNTIHDESIQKAILSSLSPEINWT